VRGPLLDCVLRVVLVILLLIAMVFIWPTPEQAALGPIVGPTRFWRRRRAFGASRPPHLHELLHPGEISRALICMASSNRLSP
jgi:hypothetical protein